MRQTRNGLFPGVEDSDFRHGAEAGSQQVQDGVGNLGHRFCQRGRGENLGAWSPADAGIGEEAGLGGFNFGRGGGAPELSGEVGDL